jgi:glycosyltransferase involved in cell wall biosynthesis
MPAMPREMMQNAGRPLRPLHVIAGLDPAYGGPSYSVPRLCEALAAAGAEPVLLSVAAERDPAGDILSSYPDRRFAQDLTRVPGLRALRCSAGFSAALNEAAVVADVVHDHGLWLLPNLQAGWAAAGAGKAFVVSPRGMLNPAALAFSATRKRVFWKLLQGPVVRRAVCLHATSGQEYAELRALGLRHPIAVIANGIDLPEEERGEGPASERTARERTVLSLGRMHPQKGLEMLLQAWAAIEKAHPFWRLLLIGPGDDRYIGKLRAMSRHLGLGRVSFEPAVYGAAKGDAYRAADFFVLPSPKENFGLTAAEALAAGRPVIATTGTPWRRLQAEGCGWCVAAAPETLIAALTAAMAMPRPALREMGGRGRAWMAREFSWHRAACDMGAVYAWLVGRGERPASIRLE